MIAATLLSAFDHRAAFGEDTKPPGDAKQIMLELVVAFKGMEDGLAASDAQALSRHAELLKAAEERLGPFQEKEESKGAATSAPERSVIRSVAAEIQALGARGDIAGASQALDEIRSACVSCHLRLRPECASKPCFPARRNVVFGHVEVRDSAGVAAKDHAHVVVFLDGLTLPAEFPAPRKNSTLSQNTRSFAPHVLPVLKGATVDFPNDDSIHHNVFSLSQPRPFDLDIYSPGKSKSVTFNKPGLVRVYCNIHPEMNASILVLNNPYFTESAPDGFYAITDVPNGTYTLRTWYEFGEEKRMEITLSDTGAHRLDLEVLQNSRRVSHRNKFGQPYREKY